MGCILMEIFRVSFIGHREVDCFFTIEEQLEDIIKNLIDTKEYVEFYVGRNGEFDIMVASVIKRVQRDYGTANNSLILVVPYPIANMDDMEKYYDEVIYPSELYNVHYKSAITKRNEWLIDNSEMLVAYVVRESGGAYECFKKAQQKDMSIILIDNEKDG